MLPQMGCLKRDVDVSPGSRGEGVVGSLVLTTRVDRLESSRLFNTNVDTGHLVPQLTSSVNPTILPYNAETKLRLVPHSTYEGIHGK